MPIREIPKAYEYQCDVCGKRHVQNDAGGHYTDSRPPHWASLIIRQDAYDYQGCAVADGTVTRLLCDLCRSDLAHLINEWAAVRAKPLPDAETTLSHAKEGAA